MLLFALLVASCSPSGSSAAPTTSVPPFGAADGGGSGQTVPPSVAPEPTGVPGLASPDTFCAAWAGYAGTLQALGVAASFGGLSSDRLAALELTAAPRLVELVDAIDASWPSQPPELVAERGVVLDKRVGPYARRARHAVDALVAAGVTEAELATLRTAWQAALAGRVAEVAVIEVPGIDPALQSELDSAGRSYDGAVTPFADDPSLLVASVPAPETDKYLAAHCPDLASSGIGDAL